MDNREVRELLASHADQLVGAEAMPPPGMTRHDRVQGLLDLAEQLRGILVPVEPDANFRRRLHGDLILEAQSRQAQPEPSLFWQHRKGILIGAAAIGSVASVAGVVIAFVLRHRQGGTTHMTAS
jgi:hypothetical protein